MQHELLHEGKDGWLFLTGGSNNVLSYYVDPEAFPRTVVDGWVKLLKARSERCAAMNMRYVHLIAPDKLSIYPEFYAGDLPYRHCSPALELPRAAAAAGVGHCVADPVAAFRDEKQRRTLFWKTDTHWSFFGCYAAYGVLCRHLGITPRAEILDGKVHTVELALDLGVKLDPVIRESFMMVDFLVGARRVGSNAIVNFKEKNKRENDADLHVGSNVVFFNVAPSAIRKKVVLFGDSFSEYRPRLLTGMLAETFQEVHFVWSTSIDWNYVRRVEPDFLITEAAERFMRMVPPDLFDVDEYAVRRLAPMLTPVG